VAIQAPDAVSLHVVDYIAPSLSDALNQADGRTVQVNSQNVVLHTRGAVQVPTPMTSIESFQMLLSNSTLAYTLISVGGLGLVAETFNPGLTFPGVFGVLMLLLGLAALGLLPVNMAGVALIVFAFILFITDLFMPTHGILTAGGVASLVCGGLLLIDTSRGPD